KTVRGAMHGFSPDSKWLIVSDEDENNNWNIYLRSLELDGKDKGPYDTDDCWISADNKLIAVEDKVGDVHQITIMALEDDKIKWHFKGMGHGFIDNKWFLILDESEVGE